MDEDSSPVSGDATAQQPDEAADRLARPVDAEPPPRLPFPVVGIGAAAGGLEPAGEFLDAMPPDSGMAFVLVQHLPPDRESHMAEVLGRRTAMPVVQVEDGMAVEPDRVCVIRPGRVLTIRDGRLHLGPPLGSPRAANRPVDDFFRSLAEEQRERAVCVVMSGMGSDGTAGARAIKAVGGVGIAQDPGSAQFPGMPQHLIDAGHADYILRPADLPEMLRAYAGHPYVRGGREADAEATLRREGQQLREILAVLRTRSRQDFAGYKKPTLLRRVQRRMGLARIAGLAEYARLLRESPGEVTALADDLLIHVTGFFRDPEAWGSLRRSVIAPLAEAREPGGPVRAWVTACSSGEEAYTLAMILVEESERAGKSLDIKVFATDLARHALAHARAGVYPGGIESDLEPGRLERFFLKDDAVYRVRPELRDRVVFAPQDVLQDPPLSRLDIATCRNLLIYLEPEVQRRVLALLHFGLNEGGALFLGSSELVAGSEELFEPVDKKARIFRRIGPTRHGSIDFPLPHAIQLDVGAPGARPAARRLDQARPTVAELTRRVLLEAHTPPAVTVDRDGRILHYHGNMHPFLRHPPGEPTHDLMALAREGVRGAVRAALHRAAAGGAKATAADGWVEVEPGRTLRVAVGASPVAAAADPGGRPGPPEFFVVSFEERGELVAAVADGPGGRGEPEPEELRRLRSAPQGTIEELQASNEELTAANQEVMSLNEELQSANEELEASKEKLQLLYEELTTVNAQLRAKMEDHMAASGDLASMLASADIAVLSLDTSSRIRRYTPAIRDLVDLISSDVGRPLSALARRFDDPHLDDDARAVLERLVPADREVAGADGRHYLRRVLPYRTADDRIDGVVITFVDVTARRQAESAFRLSEERLRLALAAARMGAWTLDLAAGAHTRDANLNRMLGLDPAETTQPFEAFLARVHPDDRAAVRAAFAASSGGGQPLSVEFRVVRPDGTVRWLRDQGDVFRTGVGSLMAGACVDVTERREAEDALRESEEQFRRAIEEAPIPVIMHAEGGEVLQLSRTWTDLTGYTLADVPTLEAWLNRAYGPGADAVREHMHELFRGGRETLGVEFSIRTRGGAVRHWSFSASAPGTLRDGRRFVVGMAVDITDRKRADDELRAGEERLRLIVESAIDYGILTLDPDRLVTSWSPGAEATFGFTREEILGRPADILFTPEDRAAGAPEEETGTALREGRAADERWHLRKDGTRFFASGVLTPLGHGGARGFVKVLRDLTERKRTEDALREARDELEWRVTERTAELARSNAALREAMAARTELLRRLVTAQEDERRRLSRELHDGLGQELTALILGLKALERATPEDAPGRERLLEVERIVNGIGRAAHDLAVEVRPTALDDIGLASALSAYVARWSERTGLATEFQPLGLDGDRLPPEVETAVYRVVQEALNNVAKHAEARRVSVMVARQDGELVTLVEDDGRGFDPERAGAGSGRRSLGLLGMRERVGLVGGTLVVESGDGEGTVVQARIPLAPQPTEADHGG